MTDAPSGGSGLDRRGFMQLAAAGAAMSEATKALVAPSDASAAVARQPSPSFTDDLNAAGIVGGVNSIIKVLRNRRGQPDDSSFTTSGIGDLGTAQSSLAMKACEIAPAP